MKKSVKRSKTRLKKLNFDCRTGLWLDNSTFVRADSAEIKVLKRKVMSPLGGIEEDVIVIFTNAVEILVNANDKIMGVAEHPEFALWLDAIDRALREIKKNPPITT
ncbi:MAG: hypothetical protein NWE78_08395 [Candidatus Bathyarchaeota archaeon]|nr:hypothetical protein [Candidatus Bathyarchaeota archaeon]